MYTSSHTACAAAWTGWSARLMHASCCHGQDVLPVAWHAMIEVVLPGRAQG